MLDFGKWRSKFFKYGPCDTSFLTDQMSAIIYVALFWLNKTRKRAKSEKSKPLRKLKAKKANRHSMYNVVRIN